MLNDNSTAREIEQQNANTKFHMDRLNRSFRLEKWKKKIARYNYAYENCRVL